MNKTTAIISAMIFLLLTSAVGYFIFQNQKLANQLEKNQKPLQSETTLKSDAPIASPTIQATPAAKILTLEELRQIIATSTNNKDHSGLLPYLKKDKIIFIIMSSSCCEPKTQSEAIDGLSYIDDGISFDFDQNSQTIKELKTKNERLTKAYVGLSTKNENLVAYTLDSKNQISQIEVSASWKLY